MRNNYTALLVCAGLTMALQSNAQQSNNASSSSADAKDYYFFKGDTLTGFDFNKAYAQAHAEGMDNEGEFPGFMYRQERAFAESKYNFIIPQTADEIHSAAYHSSSRTAGSSCNNVDLEDGNFTGWTGAIGYNQNSNAALTVTSATISTLGINSAETACSYHTLVNGLAATDPYGGFSALCPSGGTYSVRIGGESINGYHLGGCVGGGGNGITTAYSGGEIFQQTFTVSASNALFSYNYAVVLNDGSHANGSQPYFKVEVLDKNNVAIPCLQYYVQAVAGVPPTGFIKSAKKNKNDNTAVYYLPWTSNSLNLTSYMGQTVTVKFSAAGCTAGGHFGYAYIDASCSSLQIIRSSPVLCAGTTGTLTAPSGAQSYSWTQKLGSGGISGASNTQACTISKGGRYEVLVTTAAGCTYVIDTLVTVPPRLHPNFGYSKGCPGIPLIFTDSSTVASQIINWSWDFTGGLLSLLQNPVTNFILPGNYPVKLTLTDVNGCKFDTTIGVVVYNCAILPVELVSFSAERCASGVHLSWTTATEDKLMCYDIERSSDGMNFKSIGRQRALGGHNMNTDYGFTDLNPMPGLNYYRLREVDLDGKYIFSKIAVAGFDQVHSIAVDKVWPVPAADLLNYNVSSGMEGEISIEMMDITGKLVMQEVKMLSTGSNTLQTHIGSLDKGMYYLRLVKDGQVQAVKRFMK